MAIRNQWAPRLTVPHGRRPVQESALRVGLGHHHFDYYPLTIIHWRKCFPYLFIPEPGSNQQRPLQWSIWRQSRFAWSPAQYGFSRSRQDRVIMPCARSERSPGARRGKHGSSSTRTPIWGLQSRLSFVFWRSPSEHGLCRTSTSERYRWLWTW